MIKKKGLLKKKVHIRLYRVRQWAFSHKIGHPLYKIMTWHERKKKRGECVDVSHIKFIKTRRKK